MRKAKVNDTVSLIMERRSVRNFTDEKVDLDILDTILECGVYAPNARNHQNWHFCAITDEDVLKKIKIYLVEELEDMLLSKDQKEVEMAQMMFEMIKRIPNGDIFFNSTCIVIVSALKDNEMSLIDCGLAGENMALAAKSYGYDSVISASSVRHLDRESMKEFKNELGIPNNFKPAYALVLGKRAGELPEAPDRDESKVRRIYQ